MMADSKSRFRLGVTGGIGSGKTSVCRVFSVLRVPVFSADKAANEIMENDAGIRRKLNLIAGTDLYKKGNLDRMTLASLIFNDRVILEKVNALVHPAVFNSFTVWTLKQESPYVIMEAAVLFESGGRRYVDKVATVIAPVEQRIERVIQRNRLTREQIMDRMKNQIDDQLGMSQSDFIISNAENDMIIPAVLRIHTEILNLINN
jgi:dephospho-CoA kinase